MPKRSESDRAGRSFYAELSSALDCVSDAELARRLSDSRDLVGRGNVRPSHGPHREGEQWTAFLRDPVPLRAMSGGPLGLSLDVQLGYRVIADLVSRPVPPVEEDRSATGTWRVDTVFYVFRILGRTGTELLVFHYQPGPRFRGPDHPHVHVSAAMVDRAPNGEMVRYELDKRHVTTGVITLAAVVRMLIEEFGAEGRGDWQRTLDAAEDRSESMHMRTV